MLSPTESAARLAEQAAVSRWSARLLARWCIDTPELEAKIAWARFLYDDVRLAGAAARRLGEIGESPSAEPPAPWLSLLASAAALVDTQAKLTMLVETLRSRQVAQLEDHLACLDPLSDEPTARLLREARGAFRRQLQEAALIAIEDRTPVSGAGPTPAPLEAGLDLLRRAPARPARDARFSVGGPAPPIGEAGVSEDVATLALLHANLTDLEIATIEACCRFILDHQEMPWDFVEDMARQCWDEARHAELFRAALLERGGRLGQYRVSHALWEMADGQPLAVRLAIHQRIGEWTGVDGALFHGQRFLINGDHDLACKFEFVARDEITHVRIGNKWIRALAGSEQEVAAVHQRAEQRRRDFGKRVDGALTFPLNLWACEAAGFTPAEASRLQLRYREHGSQFTLPEEPRR